MASQTDIQSLFNSAVEDGMSVAATSILVNNLDQNTIAGAQGSSLDDLAGDAVTLYVRILDRSSSMNRFQDTVIEAANEQLVALGKAKGGDEILMSTWVFNQR